MFPCTFWRCRSMMEVHRGEGREGSRVLSLTASVSLPHLRSLPLLLPLLVLPSLSVTLLFAASLSCPSWSVVTLFHVAKGGDVSLGLYFFLPPLSSNDPSFSPFFSFNPNTHTLFIDHRPPPCAAYLTSISLHLSAQSMLALVCANVTSIFHRQTPFLFPHLHSPFRISAGLDRCCDAAERPDNQWEANRYRLHKLAWDQ